MGKLYALVTKVTPLEKRARTKGTGEYDYADLTLQPYDMEGHPMTHTLYDGLTGEARQLPDEVRYDAIHEKAQQLQQMNYQVGETVIIDLSMYINQYGRIETRVVRVDRYQQPQQQAPSSPFRR